MQIFFQDSALESLYSDEEPNNHNENLLFVRRQLIKTIEMLRAVPKISELSKLYIDYFPPNNEHNLHSIQLNTELYLYFKQVSGNQLLIVNVE